MLDRLSLLIYHLSQWATDLVNGQLTHLSLVSLSVVALAGLVTSLSPCLLSMLPIMVGYIGGYEVDNQWQASLRSLGFGLGLATTLAVLGLTAGLFGYVYGQVAIGLPIAVSLLAIIMGLNLLGLVPLSLPGATGLDMTDWALPAWVKAYLLGLSFGIVASPCSTPVLASLLAWVSASQKPLLGAGLLLAYAIGYVLPLVLAGSFTSSIKRLLELRQWSGWLTPASGVLLLVFGVFSLLTRLLPATPNLLS